MRLTSTTKKGGTRATPATPKSLHESKRVEMNNAAYINHKKRGTRATPASPKPLHKSKRAAMNNAAYINTKKEGTGPRPHPLSRSTNQSKWR